MSSFTKLFGRDGQPAAGDSAAIATLTAKADAAIAKNNELTLAFDKSEKELTGLKATLATAQEENSKLKAQVEEQGKTIAALEDYKAKEGERVKAAAVDIAAQGGIPAGQTPPVTGDGKQSEKLGAMASVASASNPHEYGRAIMAVLNRK